MGWYGAIMPHAWRVTVEARERRVAYLCLISLCRCLIFSELAATASSISLRACSCGDHHAHSSSDARCNVTVGQWTAPRVWQRR